MLLMNTKIWRKKRNMRRICLEIVTWVQLLNQHSPLQTAEKIAVIENSYREKWSCQQLFSSACTSCNGMTVPPQTLGGSFSAVSKPNFASKYALESSRRDLHNALLCTVLKAHILFKNSFILLSLHFFGRRRLRCNQEK